MIRRGAALSWVCCSISDENADGSTAGKRRVGSRSRQVVRRRDARIAGCRCRRSCSRLRSRCRSRWPAPATSPTGSTTQRRQKHGSPPNGSLAPPAPSYQVRATVRATARPCSFMAAPTRLRAEGASRPRRRLRIRKLRGSQRRRETTLRVLALLAGNDDVGR